MQPAWTGDEQTPWPKDSGTLHSSSEGSERLWLLLRTLAVLSHALPGARDGLLLVAGPWAVDLRDGLGQSCL